MRDLMFFLYEIVNNPSFLFLVEFVSFLSKAILLAFIAAHGMRSAKLALPYLFLIFVLLGSSLPDLAWCIVLLKRLNFFLAPQLLELSIIRLSWIGFLIEYQALGLLLQNLSNRNFKLSLLQKASIFVNILLSIGIIYFGIADLSNINIKSNAEYHWLRLCSLYAILGLLITTALVVQRANLIRAPKIIRKQIRLLIQGLIIPFVTSDFIQYYPFAFFQNYLINNYAIVSASTLFLTIALFFCTKKILGLRFLNIQSHVQPQTYSLDFIKDFKRTLEQLGQISNIKELHHIIQAFFKDNLRLLPSRTFLYLRNLDNTIIEEEGPISCNEFAVEQLIGRQHEITPQIVEYLYENKILIADEIAFNDFYESTDLTRELVAFLAAINADIFLPIYSKQILIGYIIIEQNARPEEFYNYIERDEMVVFASYLANIINLLQHHDLSSIVLQEKELREELYKKHQEINQYKESIRSFLRNTQQRKIGILFFKNRQFTYGNQAAKDLIQINIAMQEGHPIARALYKISKQVQEYKTGQTIFIKDVNDNRIVISAIPNIEHNNVIILVYYPEIADIIKEQIDQLHDPSEWDYLLYLETTESGKLIKQLMPSSHESLLHFKIQLLKLALSRKALLLEIPDEDITAMIEILHHISLREHLHTLNLQGPEKNYDIAMKLFGINNLFSADAEPSLLEKLDRTSTLFIKNIHLLSLETQHYLAEFIKYGYYHTFRGDQKASADVRILCSSNKNLAAMAQEGTFSKALFNELNKTVLNFPSLLTLPANALHDLVDGYTEQALATPTFKNLLELTEKEKNKIIEACPTSLKDLKNKVQSVLVKKSKVQHIYQESHFDPAYNITDPELIEAARLGKKALKNPKVLALLMHKFKNQNQVATFLGVNRSTVNRRCKEYNIN